MPLYEAVTARRQAAGRAGADIALGAGQYYFFGAPGSAACAAVAKAVGDDAGAGTALSAHGPRRRRSQTCYSGLPAGVTKSEGQLVTVPQGTVVLQAANASSSTPVKPNSPNAQFFVLKDNVALLRQRHHQPAAEHRPVRLSPTSRSASTARARPRSSESPGRSPTAAPTSASAAQPLNQHFAVALDNQLITVPQIDFTPVPRRDHRRRRRRHHRRLHQPDGVRISPPSCAWARCRSSSS